MRKQAKNNKNFASRETAPLTIKSKSGLSAEDVAVLRSKTQKPVYRRQPMIVRLSLSLVFLPLLSNLGLNLICLRT